MKNIKSNTFLKTLSCFIFIFSAAAFIMSVLATAAGAYIGFYDEKNKKFIETSVCKDILENKAEDYIDDFSLNNLYRSDIEDGFYITIYDRGYAKDYFENDVKTRNNKYADTTTADTTTADTTTYATDNAESVSSETNTTKTGDFFTNGKAQSSVISRSFKYESPYNEKIYEVQYELDENIPKGSYLYNLNLLYSHKNQVLFGSIFFGIISLALIVYLVISAGHRQGSEEIVLNVQDRIPLDLYYFIAIWIMVLSAVLVANGINGIWYYYEEGNYIFFAAVIYFVIVAGMTIFLATVLTTVSRLKKGKFWRNTVSFIFIKYSFKFLKKLKNIAFDFLNAIPLVWGAVLFLFITMIVNLSHAVGFTVIYDIVALLAVTKFAKMAVNLEKAAEEMANGNINFKADVKSMKWRFKKHAQNLNSLNNGISLAVEKQMKSERLKTELITNVSHDIKTPLTSIINYVDLLQKEHTPEEEKEYIDVLSRQSGRLKKLIDDLIEASKASTGNINTEMKPLMASEVIYQSAAEYDERLKKAQLDLIISVPEEEKEVTADGRLLWRVMDNLLSNACKYAQSGTRVYIDLKQNSKETVISVKNISKNRLNIDASELMERFVRGDSSRNTQGSGLGLNIAKSLIEIQNGSFDISIDGDLFKAEIRLKN